MMVTAFPSLISPRGIWMFSDIPQFFEGGGVGFLRHDGGLWGLVVVFPTMRGIIIFGVGFDGGIQTTMGTAVGGCGGMGMGVGFHCRCGRRRDVI